MTTVSMRLDPKDFELIKSGKKIVEIRLFDEKRRELKVKDKIEFLKRPEEEENILIEITNLHKYKSFLELLNDLPMEKFGYPKNHSKNKLLEEIYQIYSKEDEEKYGVLGIEIKNI